MNLWIFAKSNYNFKTILTHRELVDFRQKQTWSQIFYFPTDWLPAIWELGDLKTVVGEWMSQVS